MEQVNLGYSTKNIPVPSRKNYLQELISSTESFIKNIRWRSYFFLNPNTKPKHKDAFGFPSTKPPPYVPELKELEDGMLNIIQNIKFNQYHNKFQAEINKDVKNIKECDKLLIAADKTTNFYKIEPKQYEKLLISNITKDY